MQTRSATTAAVAVAVLGLIGYLLFDGVASGLALFVAGLVLVAVGVWGWQNDEAAERDRVNGERSA